MDPDSVVISAAPDPVSVVKSCSPEPDSDVTPEPDSPSAPEPDSGSVTGDSVSGLLVKSSGPKPGADRAVESSVVLLSAKGVVRRGLASSVYISSAAVVGSVGRTLGTSVYFTSLYSEVVFGAILVIKSFKG